METTENELLTFDEALQVLGTSRPTLYRLLSAGDVRGLKVGRQWRFRRSDLHLYMDRGPVAAAVASGPALDTELAFFMDRTGRPSAAATPEEKIMGVIENIIADAIAHKASDIHMEACTLDGETVVLLRYRIDGVLQEIRRMPGELEDAMMARWKVMADMHVGEKRVPQDGRIPLKHAGKDFDLRVSIAPVVFGEAVTIRILDPSTILLGLDKLGLTPDSMEQILRLMRQPNGFVVVAGPTGSGKTTTAYSCLLDRVGPERKTLTVEDPVECQLDYTTQIQVSPRFGLTFPAGLRSIMRLDPDVIYAGMTLDEETLALELEASLTGHLVVTTISATDAPSAISRLMNMGAPGHLLSASLTGVIAQRLARRICPDCREEIDVSTYVQFDTWRRLAAAGGYDLPSDSKFYRGKGCENCGGRGYRGRLGIFEIIEVSEPLAASITRGAEEEEIANVALDCGMRTFWADGLRKAAAGDTTLDELLRVIFTAN
ncbi:MAG: ATPase, T2SS/T4P/T4SS family [Capsulimonas sp.]|uniref:ATPase, T2SS/T4P/T4SS family n=1 Tax=Capsulimonas sp. TaxID=2494211 RepID=UPI003265C3D6